MPVQVSVSSLLEFFGPVEDPVPVKKNKDAFKRSRYNSLYPESMTGPLLPSLGELDPDDWYPFPIYAKDTHESMELFRKLLNGDYSVLKDIRIRGATTGSRLSGSSKDPDRDHRKNLDRNVLRCLASDHCPLTLKKFNWDLQYNRNFLNPGYVEYLGYVPTPITFEQYMEGEGVRPEMLGASPSLDRLSLEGYETTDTWFIDDDINCNVKGVKKFSSEIVLEIHKWMMQMVAAGPDNDILLPEEVRLQACKDIGYYD